MAGATGAHCNGRPAGLIDPHPERSGGLAGPTVHAGRVDTGSVQTTQIAPTILALLGLDPQALAAVRAEHTAVLPDVR